MIDQGVLRNIAIRFKTTKRASVASLSLTVDDNAATAYSLTADASVDKILDVAVEGRGHEAKLVITNNLSAQPIEIEAIDIAYEKQATFV